jgi:hypothetical protein
MQGKLSRPTRDPAMNPVTASATFHVGQFLEDIVGVATTRGDMSATFPTKVPFDPYCRPIKNKPVA